MSSLVRWSASAGVRAPGGGLSQIITPPVAPGPIVRRALTADTAVSGGTSVNSLSISPTGMVQDDWLLFFVVSVGGVSTHSNTAGGCTDLGSQFLQGSTTAVSMWKKKAGVAEAGPYTFDAGAARRWAIIATCWTGADPTDVVDGANVSSEGAAAQQLDHNSLTPGAAFDWHIIATASNTTAPDDGLVSFAQPGGYEELAEVASTHATSANARASLAVRELPDTSATGVQSVTITGGVNRQLAGFEVVIRVPATGATPISVTDSGQITGTEAASVAVIASTSDGGQLTGAEALSVARSGAVADSGQVTGAEAATVAVIKAITVTDSGQLTGAEAVTLAATINPTDSGQVTGAEALTAARSGTVTDTGQITGAETVGVAVPVSTADSGQLTGAEAVAVAATVPVADSGQVAGTEALASARTATVADSGQLTGAESLSVGNP